MANVLVVAELNKVSGIPDDAVINTWAFSWDGIAASATATAAQGFVQAFYNDLTDPGPPDTTTVAGILASSLSREDNANRMLCYDLGDPVSLPLGSPILTVPWTLGDLGDDEIVSECAMALSFHADLTDIPEESGSTRPAARRRGRVFLGPLRHTLTSELDAGENRRPNAFALDTVAAAATRLAVDSSFIMDGAGWSVWSRMDGVVRPVIGGWIDNAYDTIRSRGVEATSRTTWIL